MRIGALTMMCSLVLLSACAQDIEPSVKPARPVSYVNLQILDPSVTTRMAATVESWKRVEMGFEIPGRLEFMEDAGTEIEGEIVDVNGKVLSPGTVIARLDDKRYRIVLDEKKALLASAQAKFKASKIELEAVIPERLAAANADLVLQDQEVTRYTRMVAENSAPREKLDQIQAAYKVAKSTVAEVEAVLVTKAAGLEALRAQVNLAQEMVAQAQLNLDDCALIAPFTGQIARVHVISGGYTLRAQPVVTVQMMDPIKIQVAVSPRLDAQIQYNDRVRVYLPGSEESLVGYVHLKDTFADPVTRTFLVTILVRNHRVEVGGKTPEDASTPRSIGMLGLQKRDPGGPGPYFVEMDSLHEDGGGFFVWKAEGLKSGDLFQGYEPRVRVKKVRVTPGEELFDLLQLFTFRELVDYGELDPQNDVVLRGLTGDVRDGGEVLVFRERWLMRPGDVVRVGLRAAGLEPGYYVPEEAIQFNGQSYFVYLIETGDGNRTVAASIEVRIGEAVGNLQRIEAVVDGKLADGMRLILGGAHYVADGEVINPVEEVALAP